MPASRTKWMRGTQPYAKPITSNKQHPKYPSVLWFCDCSECSEYPGVNPITGLPSDGRYLTPAEHKAHISRDYQRSVVTSTLQDLTPPTPILPSPPPTLATLSTLPPLPMTQMATAARNVPILPRPVPTSERSAATPTELQQHLSQLHTLMKAIKPVDVVVGTASLVFLVPPTAQSFVPADDAMSEEIDELCQLDPLIRSNSSIIGLQQLLARLENFVRLHQNSKHVTLRLCCTIADRLVRKELTALRQLKLSEWDRQRRMLVACHTVFDSGLFVFCVSENMIDPYLHSCVSRSRFVQLRPPHACMLSLGRCSPSCLRCFH